MVRFVGILITTLVLVSCDEKPKKEIATEANEAGVIRDNNGVVVTPLPRPKSNPTY